MKLLPSRTSPRELPGAGNPPPRTPSGVWSNILPSGGALRSMSRKYFGIDLDRVTTMSDSELSQYADRASEMKRLTDVLPILENHFQTLIEGQIAYEEFNRRVLKQATAAGKKIDNAIVETFLANQDYVHHGVEMSQKTQLGMQRQGIADQNTLNLGQMDFQSALTIMAMKTQQRQREIALKPYQARQQLDLDVARRAEHQDRVELLKHGNRGQHQNGVGWWRKLWS